MWQACVQSELAVVGHNPEYADNDNPRGEILAEVYCLEVSNEDGRVFSRLVGRDKAEAERQLELLQVALDHGLDIVNHPDFFEDYPIYGSREYIVQEPEIVKKERSNDGC